MTSQRCQRQQARRVLALFTAVVCLTGATETRVHAGVSLQLGFAPPSNLNDSNGNAFLNWTGDPDKIYKVQSATNLSGANAWITEDVAKSTNSGIGPIKWMAPESLLRKKFYRLLLPQPEIFTVEPAVVLPGVAVDLYITGQCFDSNTVLTINGITQSSAVVQSSTSIVRPVFSPGTPGTYTVSIVAGGTVVSSFDVICGDPTIHPELVFQGPPDEPPASPEISSLAAWLGKKGYDHYRAKTEQRSYTAGRFMLDMIAVPGGGGGNPGGGVMDGPLSYATVKRSKSNLNNNRTVGGGGGGVTGGSEYVSLMKAKEKANQSKMLIAGGMGGGGGESEYVSLMKAKEKANQTKMVIAGGNCAGNACGYACLMKAKEKANQTKCMLAAGGEVEPFSGEVRACDADMVITGSGLDFVWARTYRSRTGTNTTMGQRWSHSYDVHVEQVSTGIVVSDGSGRRDVYKPGTNGLYSCNEFFSEGAMSNNSFTLTFADTGKWVFNAFDGSSTAGKLIQIITRNGDTMTLGYDTSGRLTTVLDDLGRTNTVAYNTDGYVASVTDFIGRSVTYQYYQGLKSDNGNAGDLKSVTSPPVTGTPNGNDFPSGKTTTYTYSKSFQTDSENHLLLTITDPKGQSAEVFSYEHSSTDPNYLRCTSAQDGTNTACRYSWTVLSPTPTSSAAIECFANDPVGNVAEYSYDARGRLVLERAYTGRSAPGVTVTATANRPTGQVRASDPAYYDTTCTWNNDSLCTRITYPQGDATECVYQRDLDSSKGPRKNGDLRVVRNLASGSGGDTDGDGFPDTKVLTSTFQYNPGFGSPALQGRVKVRFYWDRSSKDEDWRLLPTVNKVCDDGNSSAEARLLPTVNKRAITCDQGYSTTSRRMYLATPIIHNFDWEPTMEGLVVSGNGMAIKEKGTGADNNRVTNIPRKGWDGTIKGVRMAGFEDNWPANGDLDFNDQVIAYNDMRGNTTTAGYDTNGNLTHIESYARKNGAIIACDYNYRERGRLAAVTNAPDGTGHRRLDTFSYYTNGPQAGYLQSCTRDADGLALAESFEYDARGNVTRYLDANTNDWLYTYNALDQIVQEQTPLVHSTSSSCGNQCTFRITTQCAFDINDNPVLVSVANLDATGATGSPATWNTQFTYDGEDRLASVTVPTSGTNTATVVLAYDADNECVQVSSPEAAAGRDPSNVTQFSYDERNLLSDIVCAPGTTIRSHTGVTYDLDCRALSASSTLDTCTQGVCEDTEFAILRDGFGRCVSVTDALGNMETNHFDACGNYLDCSRVSATGVLLARSSYQHDALNRCTQMSEAFFDPATQLPIGSGAAVTTLTYAPNGLCVSVKDALGNTTSMAYDSACRLSSATDARGDTRVFTRDAYGNLRSVVETDQSDLGTVSSFSVACTYDTLNRMVQCTDSAGNSDGFAYDSRGNCATATDPLGNDTTFTYDGMSRCVAMACYQGAAASGIQARTGSYGYDDNSRCTSNTDANGNVTHFTYDSADNLSTVHNADGTTCSLTWSPRSNLIVEQDANGTTSTNTYDRCKNIVHRDIACRNILATTTFETFGYDGMYRLVSASNDVSSAQFSYDSMGNAISCTQDGLTQTATYDANGNRRILNCPSGAVITYIYDVINRVTNISETVNGSAHSHLASYSYDGPDRVSRITRDNGIVTRITWDGLSSAPNASGDYGWLQASGISHQTASGNVVIDRRSAMFDRNQNRIQRLQTVPFFSGGPTTSNGFSYDALNQMRHAINTKGTGTAGFTDYGLDANGNRTSVTNNGTVQTYTMDGTQGGPLDLEMNQYTMTPFGSQTYDDNGNLISSGNSATPTFYQYDCADRLVQVSAMGGDGTLQSVASFGYDALGRRISKTVYPPSPQAPVTTKFEYEVTPYKDGEAFRCQIDEERQGTTVSRIYCLMPSGTESRNPDRACVAAFTGTSTQYYHGDDLGNTLALTDANGSVLERYDYGDFGAPQFLTTDGSVETGATASTVGNPYLFHGMQWHGEVGFYEGGMTTNPLFEDPGTGRYTTRDGGGWVLVGKLGGSAFTFSGNNPWSHRRVSVNGSAAGTANGLSTKLVSGNVVGAAALITSGR